MHPSSNQGVEGKQVGKTVSLHKFGSIQSLIIDFWVGLSKV